MSASDATETKEDLGVDVDIETETEEKQSDDGRTDADADLQLSTPAKERLDAQKTLRKRKRKRHYYNAIRAQMEFYFGDANLTKDRYLKQLIEKDPYVPLEVFLTFNKMKALTSSANEIAKSLSDSQLLELDETQQKVRRKTALPADRNVDQKTLYVESLPPSVDHEWMRQVFERFGAVTYVSLPKYAKSRKSKEFGFVEFEQESSVEKAVKAFKEFNGVLCMQELDPSELTSVKAYIKEQNNEESVKETDAEELGEKDAEGTPKKRHKNMALEKDAEEPKSKKAKIEEDDDENSTATQGDEEDHSSASETIEDTKTAHEEVVEKSLEQQSGEAGQDENAATKRKPRKKKKSKIVEQHKKDAELNIDAAFYEIKVLPKRDWKRLRNTYLNLQRQKVAQLKRQAFALSSKNRQETQQRQQKKTSATEATTDASTEPPPAKKTKSSDRKLQRINMNFYGAGDDESKAKETSQNPALERAPLFSYEPGLIVEVSFLEPCVSLREFRSDMRQYDTVKYIDVKEGAMSAQLRLQSAAAAEELIRKVSCAEYKCKVLSGEAETEYWKKIERDRELKLNKLVKVPQKRGRERVKKILAKHTRFGEDDDEKKAE